MPCGSFCVYQSIKTLFHTFKLNPCQIKKHFKKMVQNSKIKWVAVSVKPNQATKAEVNLSQQGFNYLAPKIKVTTRQKNRFFSKMNLFFPGYIFVQIDEETNDARKVNSTYGVSSIVRVGNQLGSVPAPFIDGLKAIDDENSSVSLNTIEIGQTVEIVRGPFSGLVAELTRVDSSTRVKCLFDLIAGKVSASVLIDDLIAID